MREGWGENEKSCYFNLANFIWRLKDKKSSFSLDFRRTRNMKSNMGCRSEKLKTKEICQCSRPQPFKHLSHFTTPHKWYELVLESGTILSTQCDVSRQLCDLMWAWVLLYKSYVKNLEERLIAISAHINEFSCVVVCVFVEVNWSEFLCLQNVHMVCMLAMCKNTALICYW